MRSGGVWPRFGWTPAYKVLVVALILASPRWVAAVEIGFETVVHGEPARVQGSLTATATGAEAEGESVEAPLGAGEVRLDLKTGVRWTVQASAEGYWSPAQLVVPSAAAARKPVTLPLYPLGTLAGKISVPSAWTEEIHVRARFRSSGDRGRSEPDLESTVDCSVDSTAPEENEKRLRCRVPAGKLDLRVRAQGFVSHYFWEKTVVAGETLDIGSIVLQRGASVVGWVETADAAELSGCHVELTPSLTDRPSAAEEARASLLTVRGEVDERGFFHLAGVLPGSYTLTATKEGYSPSEVTNLLILEDAEADLQAALVLERPLEMALQVIPPLDPAGRRWVVMFGRALGGAPSEDPILGRPSEEGLWFRQDLRPGSYFLMLKDSRGSQIKTEILDLDARQTTFTIQVPFVAVEGRVTLAEEPLRSTVYFGGVSGAVSISAETDEDGNYSATLPEREDWPVDVIARTPPVFHRRQGMKIEPDSNQGVARLDIDLPDTLLEITVIDAAGTPVAGAGVLVMSYPPTAKPSYGNTDEDGAVSFRGLEHSTYWLEARASTAEGPLRSETVAVEVSEKSPSESTRLVVRRMNRLRGAVLSSAGAIPGAQVLAELPIRGGGEPHPLVVPEARAGGDGRFSLDLPTDVGQLDLLVMAPGFVLQRLHVAIDGETDVDILMEQTGGGTLVIEAEKDSLSHHFAERSLRVTQSGRPIDITTLQRWASMNGAPQEKSVLRIPLLPAGSYTVCWPHEAEDLPCEGGWLAPQSELTLRPPSRTSHNRLESSRQGSRFYLSTSVTLKGPTVA